MAFSDNLKSILSDFINLETIQAIQNFTETSENDQKSVDLIAKMFGFTGEFFLQNQEMIQAISLGSLNQSLIIYIMLILI